jgi:integrase/recombinase XerD
VGCTGLIVEARATRELALALVEEELSARRYAQGSRKAIRIALKDFFAWASKQGCANIFEFGRKELVRYHTVLCAQVSKRSGESLKPGTINSRFYAVALMYSCLYRSGAISVNPARDLDLKIPLSATWARRALTREEIQKFLESIDTSTKTGLRDKSLFELIYSSGLRAGEAAMLKVKDLDFERRLMIVRGKFDRDRMVPVSEVARDFLVLYLGERIDDPDAYLFPGLVGHLTRGQVSDRFRELARRFDLDRPELTTHSIRHSTATHLLENGASIRHVQELLGHRSIESTVRYTHVLTESLAKIHHEHHPRERELYEELGEDYERRLAALVRRPGGK